jgi:hypothetical protein
MKTASYNLKPWWPRPTHFIPQLHAQDASSFRRELFRDQVRLAARRLAVPVEVQDYAVAAVDNLPPDSIRPDIRRHAQEWLEQHQTIPRPPHPRRNAKARSARAPFVSLHRPWAPPATLERESLVVRLRHEQRLTFKEIAKHLELTRWRAEGIYAKAMRCRRDAFYHRYLSRPDRFDARCWTCVWRILGSSPASIRSMLTDPYYYSILPFRRPADGVPVPSNRTQLQAS